MADIQSTTAEIIGEEKRIEDRRNHRAKIYARQDGHNNDT